jgi:hypothetical protein
MVYTTKLQLNTGLMQASKGITKLASTPLPSNRQHNNTSQNYDARAPVCEYCIPNNLIEQQHSPYSRNKNSTLESETQKQAYKVVAHISCMTLLKQLKETCNTNKHKVAQIHSTTLLKELKETCNTNKHKVAQIHSTTLLKELKETCNLSVKKIGNKIACF